MTCLPGEKEVLGDPIEKLHNSNILQPYDSSAIYVDALAVQSVC